MTDQETFDPWRVANLCRTNCSWCSSLASVAHELCNMVLQLCFSQEVQCRDTTHLHQQPLSHRLNKKYLTPRVDSSVPALQLRLTVWWIIISWVWFSSDWPGFLPANLLVVHSSVKLSGLTARSRPQDTKVALQLLPTSDGYHTPTNMHSLCGTVTRSDLRSEETDGFHL